MQHLIKNVGVDLSDYQSAKLSNRDVFWQAIFKPDFYIILAEIRA